MKKIALIKYEQEWVFFYEARGMVDDVEVFWAQYKTLTDGRTIVWGLDVKSIDAVYLSELIYNWNYKVYDCFVGRLIEIVNEAYETRD